MNEAESKRDQLLADVFQSDASALATKAASVVRRTRARKKAAIGAAALAALLLCVAKVWTPFRPVHVARQALTQTTSKAKVSSQPGVPSPERGYTNLSDAELMENLKGRAVIIMKRGEGPRQVLFLEGQSQPTNGK